MLTYGSRCHCFDVLTCLTMPSCAHMHVCSRKDKRFTIMSIQGSSLYY